MLFLYFSHSIIVLESPYIFSLEICLSFAIFSVAQRAISSALLFVSLPMRTLKVIFLESDRHMTPPTPPMDRSPWMAPSKNGHAVLLLITRAMIFLCFPILGAILCL